MRIGELLMVLGSTMYPPSSQRMARGCCSEPCAPPTLDSGMWGVAPLLTLDSARPWAAVLLLEVVVASEVFFVIPVVLFVGFLGSEISTISSENKHRNVTLWIYLF